MIIITLAALWRAIFPKRYYATTKQEREAVAANSRVLRGIFYVAMLALPLIVIAAVHLATMPRDPVPRPLVLS